MRITSDNLNQLGYDFLSLRWVWSPHWNCSTNGSNTPAPARRWSGGDFRVHPLSSWKNTQRNPEMPGMSLLIAWKKSWDLSFAWKKRWDAQAAKTLLIDLIVQTTHNIGGFKCYSLVKHWKPGIFDRMIQFRYGGMCFLHWAKRCKFCCCCCCWSRAKGAIVGIPGMPRTWVSYQWYLRP